MMTNFSAIRSTLKKIELSKLASKSSLFFFFELIDQQSDQSYLHTQRYHSPRGPAAHLSSAVIHFQLTDNFTF
jgi:hypothetical protein